MRLGALALVASGACVALGACRGKKAADDAKPADAAAPVPDRISGTLTVDGKPLAIGQCRPGRDASIHVDLVTAAGVLRFVPYEPKMFWNPRPESTDRGAPLACTDLQRSWGGATRADGTTYFRGRLIFSCKGEAGAITGDVTVDCGNISPLERKLLDEGRQRKLDELKRPGTP